MPHRRRQQAISEFHLQQVERQAWQLRKELSAAQLSLKPFCAHYDACTFLQADIQRGLNLLNDRAADWEAPHRAPLTGG
ncbi:hypothetical protein RFM99_15720 [Mesorhizobium sp. VK4C]|uniref:hypothetical protein n=1 Tax=Mesorhizobium captivum TaxID=3072319 RepID=UPI002A24F046|nr:hypothetical protein [Mesorhizobium sp. VK4C]MDX8499867.1 hypothetical protein [Mesorhizobium sp. VK4C]